MSRNQYGEHIYLAFSFTLRQRPDTLFCHYRPEPCQNQRTGFGRRRIRLEKMFGAFSLSSIVRGRDLQTAKAARSRQSDSTGEIFEQGSSSNLIEVRGCSVQPLDKASQE